MTKTVTFYELIEDGVQVYASINITSTGRRFINLKYKDEVRVAYFPKSIPMNSETILDIDRFCLLIMDGFEYVVPMSEPKGRANKIKMSKIPLGTQIHICSKSGSYQLVELKDKTFIISCNKWRALHSSKLMRQNYEEHLYDNFRCVVGKRGIKEAEDGLTKIKSLLNQIV